MSVNNRIPVPVPTTLGGTGLSTIGTPNQTLQVNGGGTALVWVTVASAGFSGSATASFGASFTCYTTFTITHGSLTATSEVTFQAVDVTNPEDVAIHNFSFTVVSKGAGSWTVGVYTGIDAKGDYQIDFVGV